MSSHNLVQYLYSFESAVKLEHAAEHSDRFISHRVQGQAPGTWIAKLPVTATSVTQSYTIVAKNGAEQAVLTDVLFGSVWVCSGQSNMVC